MDYLKFRLRSFTQIRPYWTVHCGSTFELPIKYYDCRITDFDKLIYCYDICAIPWNRNPPKNTKCTILRIDSTETPSGYARLKVDGNRKKDKISYYRRPHMLDSIENGGASMKTVLTSGTTNKSQEQEDKVFAIYCPYWPIEAEEWRKRKRFYGWPNEKLIARITRGGCHFVSKLRTWSSCDDTEWRFSFSKAELLLIHSWTPDQKFVYHIIRVIKKSLSEYFGGDGSKGFQTYYFKTLMFWACEEFPPEFWTKQNTKIRVEALLLRFLRCLEEKLCPSYFIPDCNIMSHLKGEGSFQKELQVLQKFLVNEYACRNFATKVEFNLSGSFEHECLRITGMLFPINDYLNGRFPQYLSESEWFLPGMKNLHAAIEANLRLMSINNVASRKQSKDYAECLENFKCALIRNEDCELYRHFDTELSYYEVLNRILIRRQTKNSIPIYRRDLKNDGYENDDFFQKFKESAPSPLFFAVLSNLANFHFTAMQSYRESLTECKTGFDFVRKRKPEIANFDPTESDINIPLLICNSSSQIYDEHLQVILGFATLHRNVSFTNSPTVIVTSHEVCLRLEAWEFLKYIYILCEQKLSSKPEEIECFVYSKSHIGRPSLSQLMGIKVYSAAILFAALRQSRIYTRPLFGELIPHHCGHVP